MKDRFALHIRPYAATDLEAVMQLDALVLAELAVPGLPSQFDDLKDIEGQYLRNGAFAVAAKEGQLIGMGAVLYVDRHTARIRRMRVHPDCRRQGIARALLQWLEQRAIEAGKTRFVLNTLASQHKAQKFYENSGYRKLGEGEPDGFRVFMYERTLQGSGGTARHSLAKFSR